jgi:hypothetical protein
MKRPSQALAGRRVVAVIPCGCFRGVFVHGAGPLSVMLPAGWVRAFGAGRAG